MESEENFRKIIIDCYNSIREVFNDIQIKIKPHPRTQERQILDISNFLNEIDAYKYSFVTEHPSVCAAKATLVISTWTSAIFDALALGIPSIDYFITASNFQKTYPEGNSYRLMGIPSFEKYSLLKNALFTISNGKYQFPRFSEEMINLAKKIDTRDDFQNLF